MQILVNRHLVGWRFFFGASLGISGLMLLFQFLKWEIVDVITPFLLFPLEWVLYGLLALVGLGSLGYLVYGLWTRRGLLTALPLSFVLATGVALYFVPFTAIALEFDFNLNRAERDRVVAAVTSGELPPSQGTLQKLPPKFGAVSKGGNEIAIRREGDAFEVFFFTYRGILDNYSGFVYQSDEHRLPRGIGGTIVQLLTYDRHWYFIAVN